MRTTLKHFLLIHCIFLMVVLSLFFHYVLSVYIFFIIHFSKSKLMTRLIPVLNLPQKCIIHYFRYRSASISYLLWTLSRLLSYFLRTEFPVLIFFMEPLQKVYILYVLVYKSAIKMPLQHRGHTIQNTLHITWSKSAKNLLWQTAYNHNYTQKFKCSKLLQYSVMKKDRVNTYVKNNHCNYYLH